MIINHNMQALNAHRQMGVNQTNAQKNMEKLSSGLRINRAGDDAAGLAISQKMRGQIRGLDQANRNAQDGISLIQTAEGALNETHSILERMRELSVQAANDTNTTDDRSEIQKEINALTEEISRIADNTEFNTQKLLDGGAKAEGEVGNSTVTPPTGGAIGTIGSATSTPSTTSKGSVTLEINTALTTGETLTIGGKTIDVTADGTGGGADITLSAADDAATQLAAIAAAFGTSDFDVANASGTLTLTQKVAGTGATTAAAGTGAAKVTSNEKPSATTSGSTSVEITKALGVGDKLTIGGKTFEVTADGTGATGSNVGIDLSTLDTADKQANFIRGQFATGDFDATGTGATITLTQKVGGTGDVAVANLAGPAATPGKVETTISKAFGEGDTLKIGDVTFEMIATGGTAKTGNVAIDITTANDAQKQAEAIAAYFNDAANVAAGFTAVAGTGADVGKITLTQTTAGNDKVVAPELGTTKGDGKYNATLQVGANEDQIIKVSINAMDSKTLGIDKLDMKSHETAKDAIKLIDAATKLVSSERANIGAVQNRLEHTINNLGTASENLTAAESRIRDVDMAKEMMQMSKNNILQQASQAMLAQANQAPQQVLQLLR